MKLGAVDVDSLRCLLPVQLADAVERHLDGTLHRLLRHIGGSNGRVVTNHAAHCKSGRTHTRGRAR